MKSYQPLIEVLPYLQEAVEAAAVAAAEVAGSGDKTKSDQAATTAMRNALNKVPGKIKVVIGEGVRDQAPMLYIGEELGQNRSLAEEETVVIAVDPLENTKAAAKDLPNAITVLAASTGKGLFSAPDIYMEKLVVGPALAGSVDITKPVEVNLETMAQTKGVKIKDLEIVILDRERHQELIERVSKSGAKIRLIADGDILGGLSTLVPNARVDALMGVGAAPEGVITAAAVKALGGEMQAKFVTREEEESGKLVGAGDLETDRVYRESDLASGDNLVFVFSAVTQTEIVAGVSFFSGGAQTETFLLTQGPLLGKKIAKIKTLHLTTGTKDAVSLSF